MTVGVSSTRQPALGDMLAGKKLVRNTIWNLVGQGGPMLVAIFAIPLLIKALGTDKFGILSLAWMLIGYFNLFDLGLGRALTKLVAEKLGAGQDEEVPTLVWTCMGLMAVLGLAGALTVGLLAHWLVYRVLNIPPDLRIETLNAFRLFALGIPMVIGSVGLRGVLEAQQRFDLTNAVRIPMGLITFLGPLLVIQFSRSLVPIVAVLLAGRTITWVLYLVFCLHSMPELRRNISVKCRVIGPLLCFGVWITVSNIIGPALLYLDRFIIAGIISVSAVAYYTTPYDVITKLLIIPTACVGVMFPAFSATFSHDSCKTASLYARLMKYDFLAMLPIVLVTVLLARKGLSLWVGPEFASHSYQVAQLLVLGAMINSLGLISGGLIQAVGRPDLTAKLHMAELPAYLCYLLPLVHAFGIVGAAFAWVVRVSISAVVLRIMAVRVLRSPRDIPAGTAVQIGEEIAI